MNVHDVGDTNLMNSIININQIKEIMTYTKYNVSLSYMDLGSGVVVSKCEIHLIPKFKNKTTPYSFFVQIFHFLE